MKDSELLLHITLLEASGLSRENYRLLVRRWGSLSAAVEAGHDEIAKELGLLPPMVEPIMRLPDRIPEARKLFEELEENGIRVLIPADADYPERLLKRNGHPIALFCLGEPEVFHRPSISIVGSRRATDEGQGLAFEVAAAAARRGITVTSGLAPGIDTAAHRGALEGGGDTVAVLPHGILGLHERRLYRAVSLSSFGPADGFVGLSQFHPGAQFTAENALARNRTIAALGDSVLVVEARRSGGSHRTARDARQLGVPLFTVRWNEKREQNEGNSILVQRGAAPVDASSDAEDIVAVLTAGEA